MDCIRRLVGGTKTFDDIRCGICLEDYETKIENRCTRLACGHLFHPDCIKEQSHCPICKNRIVVLLPTPVILKEASQKGVDGLKFAGKMIIVALLLLFTAFTIFGTLNYLFPERAWTEENLIKIHQEMGLEPPQIYHLEISDFFYLSLCTTAFAGLVGLLCCSYNLIPNLTTRLFKEGAREIKYLPVADH